MSQAGIINVILNNPTIPIYFEGDTGFAVALFNVIRIVGANGITTSGTGNTLTVAGLNATAGADATLASVGVASFDSADFIVTDGFVQLAGSLDDIFISPYIVDSTGGLGSTFTTIQSAINQAALDISDPTEYATIYIRNGPFYTEDLIFPVNRNYHLIGLFADYTASPVYNGCAILGIHQNNGGKVVYENITLAAAIPGDPIFSGTGVNSLINCAANFANALFNLQLLCDNCWLTSFSVSDVQCILTNCYIVNALTPAVVSNGAGNLIMDNCEINLTQIQFNTGASATIKNCSGLFLTGSSNSTFIIDNCSLYQNINLPNATVRYNLLKQTDIPLSVMCLAATKQLNAFTRGNILSRRTVTASTVLTRYDQYIGVTLTSPAVTITLPSTGQIGQCFTVKDESITAGTSPISVVSAGLIDGQSSYSINVNGGCAEFMFDGTNFFVL